MAETETTKDPTVEIQTEEALEILRRIWETREVIDFPSQGGG